jgi:hypothetical protein
LRKKTALRIFSLISTLVQNTLLMATTMLLRLPYEILVEVFSNFSFLPPDTPGYFVGRGIPYQPDRELADCRATLVWPLDERESLRSMVTVETKTRTVRSRYGGGDVVLESVRCTTRQEELRT